MYHNRSDIENSIKQFITHFSSIPSRYYKGDGNRVALKMLEKIITKYGCKPEFDHFQYEDNLYSNLIVKFDNSSDTTYLFCAHFDSISDSEFAPGADDNGSGVAILLELIKIVSKLELNINLHFVFFNLEEEDANGSFHLANMYRESDIELVGVINLDTIGTWFVDISKDNPIGYVTDENSREFMDIVRKHLLLPIAESPVIWDDDHQSFWCFGYKAIELTELKSSEVIHTKNDTAEKLHYGNLTRITEGLIQLIINLDD